MRRCGWLFAIAAGMAVGCHRAPATVAVVDSASGIAPAETAAEGPPHVLTLPPAEAPLTLQERYDAALSTAFDLLNSGKSVEALAAFRKAGAIRDTEPVRTMSERLDRRLQAKTAVESVAADIRAVILDGKPDDAARLATAALQAFGESEFVPILVPLKRQADALTAQTLDAAARATRFKKEAEQHAAENNLRLAVISLEEALIYSRDAALGDPYVLLSDRLQRYDEAWARYCDCRPKPDRLEEAQAALRIALENWDTLEVRQAIDDCNLAMASRRDRLGICDFEVAGDAGAIAVAQTAASELRKSLVARYAIVERQKMMDMLDELKLNARSFAGDEFGRNEYARATGARYLVTGSVSNVNGVSVSAELIDLRTGLLVQTAHIYAPSAEAVTAMWPAFVAMLQMDDDQRLAYEAKITALDAPPPAIGEITALPPDPEATTNVPTPIAIGSFRAPDGNAFVDEVRQSLTMGGSSEASKSDHAARPRALAIAAELGDNLLRRGLYREADAQFKLAASVSNGAFDFEPRIERCRPFVLPATTTDGLPRLAVLDFVTSVELPAGIGRWAGDRLSAYFNADYSTVSYLDTNWYLGRLGMTPKQAVVDPVARFYLGRALDVRWIVVGGIWPETGGWHVSAAMFDVETGARVNSASLSVANRGELKLRLGDLVRALTAGGADRARIAVDDSRARSLLRLVEQERKLGNFATAIESLIQASRSRVSPGQIQTLLSDINVEARRRDLEMLRTAETARRKPAEDAELARRGQIVHAAEEARLALPIAPPTPDRLRSRAQAAAELFQHAKGAAQSKLWTLAADYYLSGLGLDPQPEIYAAYAKAVAGIEQQSHARRTYRDKAFRERQAAELPKLRTALDGERERRATAQETRRNAQKEADRQYSMRLIEEGRAARNREQFDAALTAFYAARRFVPGEEVDRLISVTRIARLRAMAQQQGDRGLVTVDAQIAAEAEKRARRELQIKRNHNFYSEAMRSGEESLRYKQFDLGIRKYQEALKAVRSLAALNGLRRMQQDYATAKALAETESKAMQAERKATEDAAQLVVEGQSALESDKFDDALAKFQQVRDAVPGNLDAIAGWAKARQGQLDRLMASRPRTGGAPAPAPGR